MTDDFTATAEPGPSTRLPWSGLAFGGDYNPEQWDEATWVADVRLMREAGVNLVSVGIFAWARLEPRPGEFDFGWLDRVLDLLHGAGIAVDLATPTAAPPAWFYRDHPQAWVVDRDGRRLGPGSRGICCPSSPEYGLAAARITRALAERYRGHPAVVLWHIHNEYGAPVFECHCEQSQIAFRGWLRARYGGDIGKLNAAWGTTFWGQLYSDFDEIRTPAATASVPNPAQELDFHRFCDEELRRCFRRERDLVSAITGLPATTNFMATNCPGPDLWKWCDEVDIVSNDHYLAAERADRHVLLAMDADLTRSLARGGPWILMEHSTSAVNWQPRNLAKRSGEMTRNTLAHVARGSDSALFFQWRASRTGAEKFHSAMLPHAGTASPAWAELVALGRTIAALAPVAGSRVQARVALLWDWESIWAQDLHWRPSVDLDHRERMIAFYTALWGHHVTVDFASPADDLDRYAVVIAPALYLCGEQTAKNLRGYVERGGRLVVSYFSGVVDDNDAVQPQGLIGPLGEVLGIDVQEFAPLAAGEQVTVAWPHRTATADVWSDRIRLVEAQAEATFQDGPAAGGPAVTTRRLGAGRAWYLATRFDPDALSEILAPILDEAGVTAVEAGADLEIVTRTGPRGRFTFLLNHGSDDVGLPFAGTDLITGERLTTDAIVPAGAVRVLLA